jgi:hypothetical protein
MMNFFTFFWGLPCCCFFGLFFCVPNVKGAHRCGQTPKTMEQAALVILRSLVVAGDGISNIGKAYCLRNLQRM